MSSSGPDQTVNSEKSVASQQQSLANAYLPIATDANNRSSDLYNLTKPGLDIAEGYYSKLASGDPAQLQKAIAPATESIIANSEAAKKSILDTTPRGGEQRLALDQADIAKSSKIGDLTTQAYTGSFPALSALAGQGIGLSMNELNGVLSALSGSGSADAGAATTFGSVANTQEAGKASTMSLIGSLVGAAGTAGAGALSNPALVCWIAEVLYGIDDARTHLLRYWLNNFYDKTFFGSAFMWLYRRYGVRAAEVVRTCRFARWVAGLVFGRLLERAVREVGVIECN